MSSPVEVNSFSCSGVSFCRSIKCLTDELKVSSPDKLTRYTSWWATLDCSSGRDAIDIILATQRINTIYYSCYGKMNTFRYFCRQWNIYKYISYVILRNIFKDSLISPAMDYTLLQIYWWKGTFSKSEKLLFSMLDWALKLLKSWILDNIWLEDEKSGNKLS